MSSIDTLARRVKRVQTQVEGPRHIVALHEVGSDLYTLADRSGAKVTRQELEAMCGGQHELLIEEYPQGYFGGARGTQESVTRKCEAL